MLIRAGGVVGLILFAIWLYAVIDCLTAPAERVRALPKAVWVFVVLLLSLLGALLWFVFGRPLPAYVAGSGGAGLPGGLPGPDLPEPRRRRASPRRGIAPDDDAAFLRSLDEQLQRKPDPSPDLPASDDEDEAKD